MLRLLGDLDKDDDPVPFPRLGEDEGDHGDGSASFELRSWRCLGGGKQRKGRRRPGGRGERGAARVRVEEGVGLSRRGSRWSVHMVGSPWRHGGKGVVRVRPYEEEDAKEGKGGLLLGQGEGENGPGKVFSFCFIFSFLFFLFFTVFVFVFKTKLEEKGYINF